jgi:tRNA G10  N-methylase Trm11
MGMMPPKLAQILLNLTGVGGVVWDPFCGSGTLVMEGLLAGKKMIGSDLDPARVEGARRNEAWLKKEFGVTGSAKFLAHDATLPFDHPFEAIAFEGDLGVPHGQNIRPDALRRIIQELEELYVQFFDNLKRMDFRGPVVAALPYFIQRGGGEVHLKKSIAHAERLGFKSTPFLQDPRKGERTTLKYSRAGQAVGREIFRWTRGAENSHSSF